MNEKRDYHFPNPGERRSTPNPNPPTPENDQLPIPTGNPNRIPKGKIAAGVVIGLVVVPFAGGFCAIGMGLGGYVIFGGLLALWAGYLTAAFSKSDGRRSLLALVFGAGYWLLPIAVLAAICSGGTRL
jgi:hypothetical protein